MVHRGAIHRIAQILERRNSISNLSPESFYRRNLPHIQPPGATFCITCRLADSLPKKVLWSLHEEFKKRKAELERIPGGPERARRLAREKSLFYGKWDAALDAGSGSKHLENPDVAHLVVDTWHHFNNQFYYLICYSILPNHMHCLIRPMQKSEREYFSLAKISHSIKGYTAVEANRLLNRSGKFWQHESFDHFSRSEAETRRIARYIVNNPVKTGLVKEWRHLKLLLLQAQPCAGIGMKHFMQNRGA
ncbi:hypothetical protein GX408_17215 [bacterium]|nr:hypothetical protein [bacterium]